jgi:hypothetical protein
MNHVVPPTGVQPDAIAPCYEKEDACWKAERAQQARLMMYNDVCDVHTGEAGGSGCRQPSCCSRS